jgi:FixJ family two-component response regulator
MNGRDLFDHIREIEPDLRVLFMSGYTDDVIARHGVLERGMAFLQKPFDYDVLLVKVREALAR